jgi:hypothetical protein
MAMNINEYQRTSVPRVQIGWQYILTHHHKGCKWRGKLLVILLEMLTKKTHLLKKSIIY